MNVITDSFELNIFLKKLIQRLVTKLNNTNLYFNLSIQDI